MSSNVFPCHVPCFYVFNLCFYVFMGSVLIRHINEVGPSCNTRCTFFIGWGQWNPQETGEREGYDMQQRCPEPGTVATMRPCGMRCNQGTLEQWFLMMVNYQLCSNMPICFSNIKLYFYFNSNDIDVISCHHIFSKMDVDWFLDVDGIISNEW